MKFPMAIRHFRGTEWEIIDRDSIVWALAWSEQEARNIADALNAQARFAMEGRSAQPLPNITAGKVDPK